MLATLNDLLPEAANGNFAIPCFNIFGNEDLIAILAAATAANRNVILACNKEMAEYMGVTGFAGMVRNLAEAASVKICIHLDHCYEEEQIYAALRAGFTSVMFDGSQLPLEVNIARTAEVARVAHAFGASIEGEIGSVPYTEGRDHIKSELTPPQDALRFAQNSGVDAMAISVGNIHRMTQTMSEIDFNRVEQIATLTSIPLVIHGTSGIQESDLIRLKQTRVAKFNIGTTLRMAFNRSLRQSLADHPERFDRLQIMQPVLREIEQEARRMIDLLA